MSSFWGSLAGAALSGIFAICVFILGKRKEKKDNEKAIGSLIFILMYVHENIAPKITSYIEAASKKTIEMSEDEHKNIEEIISFKSHLNQVNFLLLNKEPLVLTSTINYISAYNEIANIIKYDDYGYALVKHSKNEKTGLSKLETLKSCFSNMKENIEILRELKF